MKWLTAWLDRSPDEWRYTRRERFAYAWRHTRGLLRGLLLAWCVFVAVLWVASRIVGP